MTESLERVKDEVQGHAAESRLNSVVALFVAVAATFMALCNVKDGNTVQAMRDADTETSLGEIELIVVDVEDVIFFRGRLRFGAAFPVRR